MIIVPRATVVTDSPPDGFGLSVGTFGTVEVGGADTSRRRIAGVNTNKNATTLSTFGFVAPTVAGASVSSADDTTGIWHQRNTAATANAVAGWTFSPATSANDCDIENEMVCRFRIGSTVTSYSFGCGFADAGYFSGDPTGQAVAMFRYDTAWNSTAFIHTLTGDTVGITETATAAPFAANAIYIARIKLGVSAVDFQLRDSTGSIVHASRVTSTLPGSGVALSSFLTIETLAASARHIKLGWMNGSSL